MKQKLIHVILLMYSAFFVQSIDASITGPDFTAYSEEGILLKFRIINETFKTAALYGEHESKLVMVGGSSGNVYRDYYYGCIEGSISEHLTIPETANGYTITGIDNWALSGRTIQSITIPKTIGWIRDDAFSKSTVKRAYFDCNVDGSVQGGLSRTNKLDLQEVIIGKNVTSIGAGAFKDFLYRESALSFNNYKYKVPSLIKLSVDSENPLFDSRDNCNAIIETASNTLIQGCPTTVIPNTVQSIGEKAFYHCEKLTSITIPNSVTSIGSEAFCDCDALTTITIPSSVTSIESYAFYHCDALTTIIIPSSVTSIGEYAFSGCRGLTSVCIEDLSAWCNINFGRDGNPLVSAKHLFIGEEEIKDLVIPEDVTIIKSYAFQGCKGLTSVTIPSSVTRIENRAFYGCSSLTSVTIPSSVTSIGDYAFMDCIDLTTITIPNSVTSIGSYAFCDCDALTTITIPSSVTSIGEHAFDGRTGLTSVCIEDLSAWCNINFGRDGNPLVSAKHLFIGEEEIKDLVIPEDVTIIKSYAFQGCKGLTSVTIPSSVTTIGDYAFDGCTGLTSVYIHGKDVKAIGKGVISAASIYAHRGSNTLFYLIKSGYNPYVIETGELTGQPSIAASSTSGQLKKVDDGLQYELIYNNESYDFLSGLEPNTDYSIKIIVSLIDKDGDKHSAYLSSSFTTQPLTLTTLVPKVITEGNVIVAAESNIDDVETNVGFEWRRADWTDDFISNTAPAYLYDGTMEGLIRNLNTNHLWKYRAYYQSNSGTYYYGDWVGIDPVNTNYFEPTVHTYANVSVNGSTAEVKGYALRGTDTVMEQGFVYWKAEDGVKGRNAPPAVPDDAMTVKGIGQVMTAKLTGLDPETEYCYAAYMKTVEYETFYGEVQSFKTGTAEPPTAIQELPATNKETPSVVARYNINGLRIASPQHGINLLRMSDGTVRKVFVR